MEKDYFNDRPIDVTQSDKIKLGMEVYICTKLMQPHATVLDDLSKGYITKILTRHDHPRGLKVSIRQSCNNMELIGRIVYITKDGWILTRDGWKKEKDVNK